jgi:hypothetical protein
MVYLTGAGLLSGSKDRVTSTVDGMFARAGVRITWVHGKPRIGEESGTAVVVHVRFVWRRMDDHSAGALAYTIPFGGGVRTIMVLSDQIRIVAGDPVREPYILAHVLAHELGTF